MYVLEIIERYRGQVYFNSEGGGGGQQHLGKFFSLHWHNPNNNTKVFLILTLKHSWCKRTIFFVIFPFFYLFISSPNSCYQMFAVIFVIYISLYPYLGKKVWKICLWMIHNHSWPSPCNPEISERKLESKEVKITKN